MHRDPHTTAAEKRALLAGWYDAEPPEAEEPYTQDDEIHDDDKRHERVTRIDGVQVGNEFVSWAEFWASQEGA